jgi:hypothetical protein
MRYKKNVGSSFLIQRYFISFWVSSLTLIVVCRYGMKMRVVGPTLLTSNIALLANAKVA